MRSHSRIYRTMTRSLRDAGALENVERILVGVSGGADSAVLLHQLISLSAKGGPALCVAHVHHGLRGEEADRDVAASESLARSADVPFHILFLRNVSRKSAEHTLRERRLSALQRLALELPAQRIALGHHRDDQAETILMRLLGGSDLRGLAGMRVFRPPLWIHPLLHCSKVDILREAEECSLPFVVDSTNDQTHYRRNFLRRNVLPMLVSQFNPKLSHHLTALGESMTRVHEYMAGEAEKLLEGSSRGAHAWSASAWSMAPEALRYVAIQEAFRRVAGEGAALRRPQLAGVDHLVRTEGGLRRIALPDGITAVRQGEEIRFVSKR